VDDPRARLLLDTHVLIWSLASPERLASPARAAIEAATNTVYVSVASPWELAIKLAIGRLTLRPDLAAWLPNAIAAARFTVLPITLEHVLILEQLPLHHRDPFDRLLIAQAQVEQLTIVTADPLFELYGIALLHC
jgi:PIN domain nuclease of toxin-antitoxin system